MGRDAAPGFYMPNERLDKARFGLTGPRDLLAKLQRDIRRLNTEDKVGREHVAYIVFDCAVTAWSALDWTFHAIPVDRRSEFGISTSNERKALRQFEKYLVANKRMSWLEICHDLATGAKHFHVDSTRKPGLTTGVTGSGQRITDGPNAGSRTMSYWPFLHVGDLHEFADDFFSDVWLQWTLFLDNAGIDVRELG